MCVWLGGPGAEGCVIFEGGWSGCGCMRRCHVQSPAVSTGMQAQVLEVCLHAALASTASFWPHFSQLQSIPQYNPTVCDVITTGPSCPAWGGGSRHAACVLDSPGGGHCKRAERNGPQPCALSEGCRSQCAGQAQAEEGRWGGSPAGLLPAQGPVARAAHLPARFAAGG